MTASTRIAQEAIALLTVDAVAELLSCSVRHVYRLSDAGKMPRPVKLGNANRWRRSELDSWLSAGCPRISRVSR